MENYYTRMNLPQPVVPAVQALTLLKGQTALVTGANSGIGLAIAISLARAGANVIVNYVTKEEDAEAVAEEVRRYGQRALIAQADVSDEAQVQAMFAAAVREFGTIDILVSNAGVERNAPFHEMTHRAVGCRDERQLARRLSVRARGRARVSAPWRAAGNLGRGRQDHLHQLGPRSHSMGRPCELCRIERRAHVVDEEPRAGSCRKAHPRELHRSRGDPYANQYGGVVDYAERMPS